MNIIGIDIGTTSICGVVTNTDKRCISHTLSQANTAGICRTDGFAKMQDPNRILSISKRMIADLSQRFPDVHGIAITGQMHGILYVDRKGEAVSPLFTWQDARGGLKYRKKQSYAEALSEIGRHYCAPGFGLATHFYNFKNHGVAAQAVALCTIGDYIAAKLARVRRPVIDATNAASIGLFDLQGGCFDKTAVQEAGIDYAILPEINSSGTCIGLTKEHIPVYIAIGDNQASFVGSVKNIGTSFLINMGTGGQVSLFTPQLRHVEGLNTRPFPGGGYLLVGASLCGGKSYATLKLFFSQVCSLFGYDGQEEHLYEIMNAINHDFKRKNKLIVDTRFQGTRVDSSLRGSIINISLDNFSPQQLIVGFLEGSAAELYGFYNKIPVSIRKNRIAMVGSGNGIRENKLLRHIFELMFGYSMTLPKFAEEAAVGATLCAAVGAGVYKNVSAAAEKFHSS